MSDVEMRLRALELACEYAHAWMPGVNISALNAAEIIVGRAQKYLAFLDPTYGEPVNMTKEGPALPVAKPARRRVAKPKASRKVQRTRK